MASGSVDLPTSSGGGAPSGAAGGQLSGAYPNPDLAAAITVTTSAAVGSYISVGASVATLGLIRAPNNSDIVYARNAANTGDIGLLAITAGDNMRIGSNTGGVNPPGGMYLHTTGGSFFFHTNNTVNFTIGATTAYYSATTAAPKFGQTTTATASATGAVLTVQAQIASGTTSTGGDLILASGTGTTANGRVGVANVATTATAPTAGAAGALPATPTGYVTLLVNGVARQVAYY